MAARTTRHIVETSLRTRLATTAGNHNSLIHQRQISTLLLKSSTGLSTASNNISSRRCWYHSTASGLHAFVHKDAQAAQPTEEELNETDETIPVWQNPLHHNNPEMKKMFAEDFENGEEMIEIPLPPLETDPSKVVAPPHIHQLAHEIVQLSMLEMKELTDKIADHFGFDDAMMAASYGGGAAMAGAGAGGGEAAAEEVEVKTIFDLKLIGFDAKAKIKVIKEVRAILGLGLKEAKELVEAAPKVIHKDLKQEKADELKAQLEAVGAEIELV